MDYTKHHDSRVYVPSPERGGFMLAMRVRMAVGGARR